MIHFRWVCPTAYLLPVRPASDLIIGMVDTEANKMSATTENLLLALQEMLEGVLQGESKWAQKEIQIHTQKFKEHQ